MLKLIFYDERTTTPAGGRKPAHSEEKGQGKVIYIAGPIIGTEACIALADEVHVIQDDLYPCDLDKNDRCKNGGRMIRTINARDAVEFLRENELTITRCKDCYQHKDIDDRYYCRKLEMYVDGDWFCKDAKANECDTCFIPMFCNLEDDDSICRDCGVGE